MVRLFNVSIRLTSALIPHFHDTAVKSGAVLTVLGLYIPVAYSL